MYNHNKAQQSKNRVHICWDILYLCQQKGVPDIHDIESIICVTTQPTGFPFMCNMHETW